MGMSVKVPEISQNAQCVFRQRNQPVFVALGVTDMPHVGGVYISHRQLDTFAKTQPHAVDGEEKGMITKLGWILLVFKSRLPETPKVIFL